MPNKNQPFSARAWNFGIPAIEIYAAFNFERVQGIVRNKIGRTGIGKYFQHVIISEIVGVNKPDKAIFEYALNLAGAVKAESLMIGDSLDADVRGALNFGMDAIYFNPFNQPKPDDVPVQVMNLKELTLLL